MRQIRGLKPISASYSEHQAREVIAIEDDLEYNRMVKAAILSNRREFLVARITQPLIVGYNPGRWGVTRVVFIEKWTDEEAEEFEQFFFYALIDVNKAIKKLEERQRNVNKVVR